MKLLFTTPSGLADLLACGKEFKMNHLTYLLNLKTEHVVSERWLWKSSLNRLFQTQRWMQSNLSGELYGATCNFVNVQRKRVAKQECRWSSLNIPTGTLEEREPGREINPVFWTSPTPTSTRERTDRKEERRKEKRWEEGSVNRQKPERQIYWDFSLQSWRTTPLTNRDTTSGLITASILCVCVCAFP